MSILGALETAITLGLVGVGVVTPIALVRRAIRTRDPFDRPFLLASAVGAVLWVLVVLTMYANTLVPDSAAPVWIANPLEGYATATTWLYRNRNLFTILMYTSIILAMLGAVAAPPRRQRARRRLPE